MAERTPLTPADELAFQTWAKQNRIRDVDAPQSRYDYRGYWNDIAKGGGDQTKMYGDGLHFTDKYKQHGHPTFSVESQYSAGPFDGGRWLDTLPIAGSERLMNSRGQTQAAPVMGPDRFVPSGADMMINARGQSRINPQLIREALLAKMKGGQ